MERIKVKIITQAERCEICHQKDYFDPEKETCLRCLETIGNELVIDKKENVLGLFGRTREYAVLDLRKPMEEEITYFSKGKTFVLESYRSQIIGSLIGIFLGAMYIIFLYLQACQYWGGYLGNWTFYFFSPIVLLCFLAIVACLGFLVGCLFDLSQLLNRF